MENENKQVSGSEMAEDQLHEHHSFKADPGQEPLRVDKYLMNRIENATRNKIQQAAKTGSIQVDGVPVKSSYKIKGGDEVKVLLVSSTSRKSFNTRRNVFGHYV